MYNYYQKDEKFNWGIIKNKTNPDDYYTLLFLRVFTKKVIF